MDLLADPGGQTPGPKELDYALLRLSDDIGAQPVAGGKADPGTPKRGWLSPLATYPFPKAAPIFIVQHPETRPLKLALDTKSVIARVLSLLGVEAPERM